MIHNFKTKDAEAVWNGKTPKGFPSDLVRPAQRKLAMLAAAIDLIALRQPPGNRLEALKGNRDAVSTAFGSTTIGASASSGVTVRSMTLRLSIIIEAEEIDPC